MTTILDGKEVRKHVLARVEEGANQLKDKGVTPKLVVVRVEGDDASEAYEKAAVKTMTKVGIESDTVTFKSDASYEEVAKSIEKLNADDSVHGVIVMQPLPEAISRSQISELLSAKKDVDGLTPANLGKIINNDPETLFPSTPKAVMEILDYYEINLEGKEVTVIGASPVVGLPMANMLINRGATVTTTHIYTKDTASHSSKADIVVSATGALGLVKENFVGEDAVVVDVGFGYKDGKATGDVSYDEVKDKTSYITPVPGGVGSVTTSVLASQVLKAAKILTDNN